jgi:hypothetical protein
MMMNNEVNPPSLPRRRRQSINDFLMQNAQEKRPPHSWLNIHTWGMLNESGDYTRLLGKKPITIYKNPSQEWQYVYNGKHSTSYTTLDGALSASYFSLKTEILLHVPV